MRKYAGAFGRSLKKFGDVITVGHGSFHDMQYALIGCTVGLVVRAVSTTFGVIYLAPSKSTDETVTALQESIGDETVTRLYSDSADELMSAARRLIPHEASQQGMPQTNGVVEREVQDMLTGTRTLLVAAGLPGQLWSIAASCYMHV